MDDIDGMLARLAAVASPRSLVDDPAFLARLDASATQGAVLGMARSAAIGVVAAALMVAVHVGTATDPAPGSGGGPLLTTTNGVVL